MASLSSEYSGLPRESKVRPGRKISRRLLAGSTEKVPTGTVPLAVLMIWNEPEVTELRSTGCEKSRVISEFCPTLTMEQLTGSPSMPLPQPREQDSRNIGPPPVEESSSLAEQPAARTSAKPTREAWPGRIARSDDLLGCIQLRGCGQEQGDRGGDRGGSRDAVSRPATTRGRGPRRGSEGAGGSRAGGLRRTGSGG